MEKVVTCSRIVLCMLEWSPHLVFLIAGTAMADLMVCTVLWHMVGVAEITEVTVQIIVVDTEEDLVVEVEVIEAMVVDTI